MGLMYVETMFQIFLLHRRVKKKRAPKIQVSFCLFDILFMIFGKYISLSILKSFCFQDDRNNIVCHNSGSISKREIVRYMSTEWRHTDRQTDRQKVKLRKKGEQVKSRETEAETERCIERKKEQEVGIKR